MNNQTNKISVTSKDNFTVQTGTIPTGITADGSKYPINVSDVSITNPNDQPTYEPFIPITYLYRDFNIDLNRNWQHRIKPGNPLQVIRGNIRSEYNVQYIRYNPVYDISTIRLSHTRDVVDLLDPFIDTLGYPLPASDSYITLDRRVENPNTITANINSFGVKMVSNSSSTFNVNVNWDVDPNISSVRLRWRSVPRNYSISELSFTLNQTGEYSEIPTAKVISTTGRNCLLKLQGVVQRVEVDQSGSGYTYANAVCNPDNETTLSVNLDGDSIDSIDVLTSNYFESRPEIIITGDGVGGAAHVSSLAVDDLQILQQGANYLSAPTVEVIGNVVGLTATEISSTVNTNNGGRIDYIRVLNGGYGYTGASVTITGGSPDAIATPIIENGVITDIELIYPGGNYVTPDVVILPIGTGGTGAQAIANVDIYSQWVYQDINMQDSSVLLTGFKYNIPYEIEILASEDLYFKGMNRYTNNTHFQYYK